MKRLFFCYIVGIIIAAALLSGCTTMRGPQTDQLLLNVPEDLLKEPKPIRKL